MRAISTGISSCRNNRSPVRCIAILPIEATIYPPTGKSSLRLPLNNSETQVPFVRGWVMIDGKDAGNQDANVRAIFGPCFLGAESGLTVGCCLIQNEVHDGDTDSIRGVGTRMDALLDLVGREGLTAVGGSQDA
jgi:hypothetical protein